MTIFFPLQMLTFLKSMCFSLHIYQFLGILPFLSRVNFKMLVKNSSNAVALNFYRRLNIRSK